MRHHTKELVKCQFGLFQKIAVYKTCHNEFPRGSTKDVFLALEQYVDIFLTYAGFFCWLSNKICMSVFWEPDKILLIGKVLKFGLIFSKFLLKIIKNLKKLLKKLEKNAKSLTKISFFGQE